MKIDISTIQETHWINNEEWGEGGYTFYVTAARKSEMEANKKTNLKDGNQKGIGGIAISIRKEPGGIF